MMIIHSNYTRIYCAHGIFNDYWMLKLVKPCFTGSYEQFHNNFIAGIIIPAIAWYVNNLSALEIYFRFSAAPKAGKPAQLLTPLTCILHLFQTNWPGEAQL